MEYPPSPAAVPAELLDSPAFRQALASRDFHRVFTLASGAGLSFNRIAEACAMKAERVSKVARGTAAVTAFDVVERIADGLRIPGVLLGLAARPWELPARTTSTEFQHDEDDPMKRRDLLRGALAAGLSGAALTDLSESRTRFDVALSAAPTTDLAYLETAAEQYSYGYKGQDPAAHLADLVGDFNDLRPHLERAQTVVARTRLCHIAGQLAGMTAIVLHDLGDRREARAWFTTAAQSATESGDRHLTAWILAREAMVPLNFGAPRSAATLAERARRVAGADPTAASAVAAAVAARAYALTGQHDLAYQALADADRLADQLPEHERTDTWFGFCERKHNVHLSHALTVLGDTQRARVAQDAALAVTGSGSMAGALLRIDAAACLHHEGDTQGACEAATAALTDLPPAFRTGLTRGRALDLYRSIPPRHHHEQAARDLRSALAV